jgi:putative ABC transport system permease protein
MKFLPLVWRNLLRRKIRTTFTLLSILVAFLLFGLLAAISTAFTMGLDIAGADRLVMIHKVSFIQPLPENYRGRIEATQGVSDATFATWFGGIYRDPKDFFAQMPVDPESFMRMYPEYVLPAGQMKDWMADRSGAIVGRGLATRFGWKIGDKVALQPTIWHKKTGGAWEFTIRGIYEAGKKGADDTQMFFQHAYFKEARTEGEGLVGWYVIRVGNPNDAEAIARRLDTQFANSEYETKTEPEKAFVAAFAKQVGDVGAIMMAIMTAVFFTILLVAGNTMAQSVRERISELGVLKTLGFSNALVLVLVIAESCAIALVGGTIGLALAWIITENVSFGNFFPVFYIPPRWMAAGALFVAGLGLVAGALPALQAMRLRITDALRRV